MEDMAPRDQGPIPAMHETCSPDQPLRPECFASDCPSRDIIDQIADKWSMMILSVLSSGPTRFNEVKRRLEGISQKSLSQTLRKLERNGLVTREVLNTAPVAVQYSLSPLGRSLLPTFLAFYSWTKEHMHMVEAARAKFDARQR
ncbi:transcriptional regulator, HxlR family [Pseudooceanicola antarcticus]|uniref:Transcriptional regulator, HxlR family n=2 Tax=Pseudooceanicola antarcticus TaxID=1247613 RepID=A0A285IZ07_9RHOB|nr:helix-turn-helix domain-containing protein [Pseudooceanicola antarcticus]SNY53198.1 transcriptional regulator, HxlR family [Pseudooceanicola antarcticus]